MKKRKILIISIVIFSILLTTFAFYGYQIVYSPNVLVNKSDKLLYIPRQADFGVVQDSLYYGDYVQDMVSFSFLAKIMKYQEHVKPGRYLLKKDMTNVELIRMLRAGLQEPTDITFNNIRTKTELAQKLTDNLEISASDLEVLLNDSALAARYGFNLQTIQSMFLPNTYEVYWDTTAEEIFERMYREYNNFWTEERLSKADSLNLSPQEVSILASIVQAETKKREESPIIAGLYLNRLHRGIPLQADPTLIFAANDFTIKRVLNKHKEIDSPYNTYKYAGLPPGPINLPSIHSIKAVLDPRDHNYIYMCAKEDFSGYHYFTSSLSQHLNNARKFQNALNKARLYR
ncbi:MAG: endolytic transglycosylase MltG [Candidatus Cyclobacteriaceae bacterium M3_2C_046]